MQTQQRPMRDIRSSSVLGLAAMVVAGSTAVAGAATIFNVSGSATTQGGHGGDAVLESVSYDGTTFGADRFVYAANVANVIYSGAVGQLRVVSGPQTSKNNTDLRINTTSFQKIESVDGDAGSVSDADRRGFATSIRDAYRNRNLNNYVDLLDTRESYAFTVTFASELIDNNPTANDAVGELLYFERGFMGSNSYVLVGLDNSGQPVGGPVTVTTGQVVIDPRDGSSFSPQPLTPRTNVAVYDSNGNVIGSQEMEGLAIDISQAFGVGQIRSVRVSVPTGNLEGVEAGGRYDTAPDVKLLGVDTTNGNPVPEPSAVVLLTGAAAIMLRRRR